MQSFPMFIRTTARAVLIVGGGEQAAQKTRLILKTDAHIRLVADELDPELEELVASGRAEWHQGDITSKLFESAAFAFIATGSPAADACLHALAKAARCLVNVVDRPDLCDLVTPSIVDRDPVVVAIGTEGTAPVLARKLKTRLEELLPHNVGGLAKLAGRMRSAVARHVPKDQRRAFWRWVFAETPYKAWVRGAEREAAVAIKEALAAGAAPDDKGTGVISLVGAGPGAKDLLTLRAVQRLQEADVIYYDRLSGEEALELARRDAERVYVGKSVGAHHWPQAQINQVIVSEAKQGKRVVRLKSGDPAIFGRAGEELAAARAAGIDVEIIPGVTAASAAAASAEMSLTQRGITDSLILTTARTQEGDPLPDAVRNLSPGTTVAYYMATQQAEALEASMLAKGVPANAEVTFVAEASKPGEQVLQTRLNQLAETVRDSGVTGGAMILVKWAKVTATQPSLKIER